MEQAPRHASYAAALTARFSSRKKRGPFTNAPAAASVFSTPGPEELCRLNEKEFFGSHYSERPNLHAKSLAESDTGLPIDRPKSLLKK